MPSLWRIADEAPFVSGGPVQGLGLLFDGLREVRKEAGGLFEGERGRFLEREGVGRRRRDRSRSRDEGRNGGRFFEREEGFRGFEGEEPGRGEELGIGRFRRGTFQ